MIIKLIIEETKILHTNDNIHKIRYVCIFSKI